MDMWKKGRSRISRSCSAMLDLPELDVPLRKMICPVRGAAELIASSLRLGLNEVPAVAALVDEGLGAEDEGECEPVGVLGAGFGGVDRDPQVVAGDDEGVAVECDESDVGVVDDLVPGPLLGRADLARRPQLGEARAV